MNYSCNEATTSTRNTPVCEGSECSIDETIKSIVDETNQNLRSIYSRLSGINDFAFGDGCLPTDDSNPKCLKDVLLENRGISNAALKCLEDIMKKLGV